MSRQAIFSRGRVVPAAAKLSAAAILSAALLFAAAAPAQLPVAANSVAPSRVAANRAALKKFVDASNKISPEVSKHLSRGLQNYLRYANAVMNGTAPVKFRGQQTEKDQLEPVELNSGLRSRARSGGTRLHAEHHFERLVRQQHRGRL